MVKKIIAVIALIALLSVAIVQAMDKNSDAKTNAKNTEATATAQSSGLQIGSKAPDFSLKTLSGETVKLSELKGKRIMLNFWATWCPPCKKEMPEIENFFNEGQKDVVILAVNIDPQLDVKGFVKKNGITFPVLLDQDDQVNGMYKIISIPTTYFIDSNGIIQNKYTGSLTLEMMKKYISDLK